MINSTMYTILYSQYIAEVHATKIVQCSAAI